MPATLILVDDVATDEHLTDRIGAEELANILPDGWSDAEKARQEALDEVVDALTRRTPPIREGQIADPVELRRAVVFGALELLYRHSITSGAPDDPHQKQADHYLKRFNAEKAGLTPTLAHGLRGPGRALSIERR